MNLRRTRRLRHRQRLSKARAAKLGLKGRRPLVKAHPRRKPAGKRGAKLNRAERIKLKLL